jgi:predicted amidohydrolase
MRILAPVVSIGLASFLCWPVLAGELSVRSTSNLTPRKVVVGTVVQGYWVKYPGVEQRSRELTGEIDKMAEQAKAKYGRGLDLVVFPEVAVTGDAGGLMAHSTPFEGPVRQAFSRAAQKHHCYIVVPMFLLENEASKLVYNVGILVGRNGETVGTYRKLHLAVPAGRDSMEDGVTPGKEVPVFDCDFGKLGIQICFDMEYDYGWTELARKGADLVVWPTQAPGTAHPAFRALQNRYYIVSSTWRNNASVFEPTGKITAQARPPEHILVQEIDLSYALVPWSGKLRNGAAFKEKYGDKVGFRYYEDEDGGIFWSNDPRMTVGQMVRSLHLNECEDELRRIQGLYHKAGVPGS